MTIYKIKAVDKSQFFNATFNFVPCFLEHLKKIIDESANVETFNVHSRDVSPCPHSETLSPSRDVGLEV